MNKKTLKKLDAINEEASLLNAAERLNRARSVTVGTAFNGVVELMVRGDGKFLWAALQPTEAIELIHQLAAGVGCHIHIQPRNDFASWREWRATPESSPVSPGLSYPPHPNHPPLTGMESSQVRRDLDEQIMATQKTVGRKRTKRAATAA